MCVNVAFWGLWGKITLRPDYSEKVHQNTWWVYINFCRRGCLSSLGESIWVKVIDKNGQKNLLIPTSPSPIFPTQKPSIDSSHKSTLIILANGSSLSVRLYSPLKRKPLKNLNFSNVQLARPNFVVRLPIKTHINLSSHQLAQTWLKKRNQTLS